MPFLTPNQPGYSVVRACKGLPPDGPSTDPRVRDPLCRDCRNLAGAHSPADAQPMARRVRLLAGVLLTCMDRREVHGGTVTRIRVVAHPYHVGVSASAGNGLRVAPCR
jgi:hypothetical protein